GALDGFAVFDSGGNLTAFQPAGANASGSTTVSGTTVTFTGMDAYNPLGGGAANRVFTGSIFDRDIKLEAPAPGQMKVSFTNLSFTSGGNSFTFASPTASLTLTTGSGDDTIAVASLDTAFSGALLQYSGGVLKADLTANPDTVGIVLAGG